MSQSEDFGEAQRWLDTAAVELRAARELAGAGYHAQACFFSQQCRRRPPRRCGSGFGAIPGDIPFKCLSRNFPSNDRLDDLAGLREKAAVLDRFYIPTRYPNGLPDLTPDKTYFPADSAQAIRLADELWQTCKSLVDAY